jgi:hypothetical protein
VFSLKFTPEIVPAAEQLPADLIVSICVLRAAINISEVLVDLKDATSRKFLYRITAVDGRVWKQFLYVPDASDSSMTFDVPDAWELSEFAPGSVAWFDRATSDNALVVQEGGLYQSFGATPDWGTNNAGHGVVVSSGGYSSYVTKPTINSGLGAGREAKVGGTDKEYSAIPHVEATNNAALVLTA